MLFRTVKLLIHDENRWHTQASKELTHIGVNRTRREGKCDCTHLFERVRSDNMAIDNARTQPVILEMNLPRGPVERSFSGSIRDASDRKFNHSPIQTACTGADGNKSGILTLSEKIVHCLEKNNSPGYVDLDGDDCYQVLS